MPLCTIDRFLNLPGFRLSLFEQKITLCHRKFLKNHHQYFLIISKRTLNLNVKAILTCGFFWSFCWADGCNISSTFYWSMRNTFKVRIKMPFTNLINGLRSFHFTIFLDLSPSPTYLLHLFNGNFMIGFIINSAWKSATEWV